MHVEGAPLTKEDISQAHTAFEETTERSPINAALKAVGSIRVDEQSGYQLERRVNYYREAFVKRLSKLKEKNQNAYGKGYDEDALIFPSPIEALEKKGMKYAEPQVFELVRILAKKEYQQAVFKQTLEILYEQMRDGTYTGPSELVDQLSAEAVSTRIDSNARDITDIASELYLNAEFKDIKTQIEAYAANNIPQEKLKDAAVDDIWERLQQLKAKDSLPAFQHCKLSYGLEVEAEAKGAYTEKEYRAIERRFDLTQELGIPVSYDNLRELPLPPTFSHKDQLRVIYELTKAGLLKGKFDLNYHINVGGAQIPFDDGMVLHYIARSANLFNSSSRYKTSHPDDSPLEFASDARKPAQLNDQFITEYGGPIMYRYNTDIVEFRSIGGSTDFYTMAKGFNSFGALVECCAAKTRLRRNPTNKRDIELATAWDIIKEEALGMWRADIPNTETFFRDAQVEQGGMYRLANRSEALDGKVMYKSNTDEDFRKDFGSLCLFARQVFNERGY